MAENVLTGEKPPQELCRERLKRIEDAVQLSVPDRVPFLPSAHFFPTNYCGVNAREAMYNYDQLAGAWKKYTCEFQPDLYTNPFNKVALGRLFEVLDSRQFKWPGHGVSPENSFQFVEGEHMKAEEYDEYLSDPSDFMLRKYLPRIAGSLENLKLLPCLAELHYLRIPFAAAILDSSELIELGRTLTRAGQLAHEVRLRAGEFVQEMETAGFPAEFGAIVNAPFDFVGDYFRGTRGVMLDMYRNPDRLLQMIEKVSPIVTRWAIATAKRARTPRVFIPLHKGADGFMSLEQFKTFYWPGLRRLMLALIEEGLTPFPFFEGQYASRLEIIADIPRGKAVYMFEHTDIFRAKEVLGDRACLRGNVPASLLISGSPGEVRDYCRKLIAIVGKGGGFMMDGASGIPDEARVDNVRAMAEATREYGVYA
ncbi:MAG: hypothetical protein HYY29_00465 [Chloroflexi bacterium]|nr:hypothetical protein [Chloroflexota bacterium]